ncbi:MAG: hypothetical protein FD165_1544 [Gammaproteobacteria bacterium]|nr:MAG: hypothetical protein FD165_1544 [Gammaproteobacteria bacterium]TND02445.1 MAG: hypothetical protein FD120_2186 [Gammaproteobacteria bacterium]
MEGQQLSSGAVVRILYVEDDPANKALVHKLLVNAGYQVLEASDGIEGINMAQAEHPDLILMDMNMPGLDGYEATTRIKAIADLASIPVIAITANAIDGDRERSLVAGCDGYISKPIDVGTFVATVTSYVSGKQEVLEDSAKNGYLKEYNRRLVEKLELKVRELMDMNAQLEKRVEVKIKELESAQDQLLQSEKMASIGQLAAGVAHEINNPVGYINSNIGTLKRYVEDLFRMLSAYEGVEPSLPQQQRDPVVALKKEIDLNFLKEDIAQLVNESIEGVTRVRQIVQDLKDFSHVDEAEWQWANLHRGIDSTLNIVNNELKYKADVVKEYGDLPDVECIASQLNQVFMNMLVNAAHAIESRGTITVRTGKQGDDWVWAKIMDTGNGIPPDKIKRIFEPFFTTKPVGKGTGLGLSLSYSIVQKHHGRIEVESEAGKGTTFTVWLPVTQAEAKAGR